MNKLFSSSKYDGDLSKWNISNVTKATNMFACADYTGKNGDLSKWNISNVNNMISMFKNSNYNNDLSSWKINDNCYSRNMFYYCPIENKYKPYKDDERID